MPRVEPRGAVALAVLGAAALLFLSLVLGLVVRVFGWASGLY